MFLRDIWRNIKVVWTAVLVELGVIKIELSTVDNISQVLKNITQFNRELKSEPFINRKLPQFKHWYYSSTLNMFGPSKYIGYRDMNLAKYVSSLDYNIDFDGRDTEAALKKWIEPLNEEEVTQRTLQLRDLLANHGKVPNKAFQLHILKD